MESNTTVAKLPEELQREIFEIVARSNPRDAAMLLTVEKRVYYWVEPLLYEVILDQTTLHSEEWYIEHGKHIHHLLMVADHPEYIQHCSNLHDLAIWTVPSPSVMTYVEALRLRRLSAELPHLFGSAAAFQERASAPQPLFPYLTHLDLLHFQGEWEEWSGIALLPRLTHVGLGEDPESMIRGILDHCQHLCVLAILTQAEEMPYGKNVRRMKSSDWDDHRVVHIEVFSSFEDWEAGARGHFDAWSLADKIVGARIERLGKNGSDRGTRT